jgi:DNA-binding response OmpR family regulator
MPNPKPSFNQYNNQLAKSQGTAVDVAPSPSDEAQNAIAYPPPTLPTSDLQLPQLNAVEQKQGLSPESVSR